jgi:hypothetical protein
MRPTYENQQSLAAEEQTIIKVAQAWGVTYQKLPKQYRVDWALSKGKIVCWCECKKRMNDSCTYPTLLLSLSKVMHGVEMYRVTSIPFVVVVEWNDGIYWNKIDKVGEIGFGGRKDRGDWQDIEPVVHIPVTDFKQLTK